MGDLFGGGQKTPKATKLQAQLAEQLFQQSAPIRSALFGRSMDFLSGGNGMDNPAYRALQLDVGQNFNQAKDNLISRFAPGGAMIEAMAGLEGDRASTLARGAAGIYDSELSRAMNLGTGVTGLALGSLGQAGNVQAQIANANAQEKAGTMGAVGAGLGGYLGAK